MHHTALTWAGGGALFIAAASIAAVTTRRLARPQPDDRAVTALLSMLATSALAVTAAALWAGPGTAFVSTWPFAIALVIAMGPLLLAAVTVRVRPARSANRTDHGRPPPR